MPGIQAVCFDGFEAVVQITRERRPFEILLKGQLNGPRGKIVMTRKMGLRDAVREFEVQIDAFELAQLESDLEEECASTRLRPGMDVAWAALRRLKLKIGVCSNLAAPYEQSLLACLPGIPDALVLSFDAGVIKPQPEFFRIVAAELRLEPSEILFVCDGSNCDIEGACAAGMFAVTTYQFGRASVDRAPKEVIDLLSSLAMDEDSAWKAGLQSPRTFENGSAGL